MRHTDTHRTTLLPERLRRTLTQGLAVALVFTLQAVALAQGVDYWYVVRLGDQRAGWMHFQEINLGYGLQTKNTIHIEVARGPASISVELDSSFTETYDGKPFEMVTTQELGAAPVTKTFRWQKDGTIKVAVETNDESTLSTLDPIPGDWLTPAAARRVVAQYLADGAPRFDYLVLDVMGGPAPIKISSTRVRDTTIDAVGKTVPAIELRTEQSVSPGAITTEYLAADGVPVKTELQLGNMTLTIVRSEEEVARGKIDPAEIMLSTFVAPSRAIAQPRRLRSASYILSVPDTFIGDIPRTSVQRVERIDDRHIRVSVDMDDPTPAAPDAFKDPSYRAGSTMLNWRDPKIGALAERAINKNHEMPKAEMAERARRYAHVYIRNKNLDVGFASASETCRTREGDCTEHAALLAAMLRYLGIPSRVAGGLIYAEEFAGRSRIFGYHMWTQALLQDASGRWRWVDLDATLDPGAPFDATHIALSLSAMNEGDEINSMAALAPLLGRLAIEVDRTGEPTP